MEGEGRVEKEEGVEKVEEEKGEEEGTCKDKAEKNGEDGHINVDEEFCGDFTFFYQFGDVG